MTADDTSARPDPLLGQTLSERYRITRKIGEGGMGTVYEAEHVVLHKGVAVKVLREKYADRPSVAKRLVQEAQLASAIRHDHIIDITDSGRTDDGRTFVVMELIEGQSLAELLRREGALPEGRALAIVRQVAAALAAAHERGIVHRDVKPENVLLGASDFAKVVDFGISKTVKAEGDDPEQRLTSTGVVMGTPFYMAPEQARGDEEVDHRIDVYALGVILYECLTGEVPFRGANYLGILQKVANEEATPPRALRPELSISEAAEHLVKKAMAKAREDRYQTMAAFEADLQRVIAGKPIDAPITHAPARKRARRVTPLALAAGAAVIAAVVAIVVIVQSRHPAPPPAPRQVVVAPPSNVVVPPPPPAPNVVLHVETTPPGAEVRQGDHVFGRAPRDLMLPRSSTPVKLTFHLDGYDVASAEVVPLSDYTVPVKLDARPKQKRPRTPAPRDKTAESHAQPEVGKTIGSEIPDNPYKPKPQPK
jgi:serine/threonine-protein kinase